MALKRAPLPFDTCPGCQVGETGTIPDKHALGCSDHDNGLIHDEEQCTMCALVHQGRPFEVDA